MSIASCKQGVCSAEGEQVAVPSKGNKNRNTGGGGGSGGDLSRLRARRR